MDAASGGERRGGPTAAALPVVAAAAAVAAAHLAGAALTAARPFPGAWLGAAALAGALALAPRARVTIAAAGALALLALDVVALGLPWRASLAATCGGLAEALVAAAVARRAFAAGGLSPRGAVLFVVGATVAAPLLGGLAALGAGVLLGAAPPSPRAWNAAHGLAMATLVPLALAVRGEGRRLRARAAEAALVLAASLAAAWQSFLVAPGTDAHHFLLAPVGVWAALRLGVGGVSASTLAVAATVVAGHARGLGVPAEGTATLDALLLLGVLGSTGLVLAAASETSRRARLAAEASADRSGHVLGVLEQFLRHSPVPVFVRDDGCRFVDVSESYAAMVGRARREIAGRATHEIWPAELAARFQEEDARALAAGEVVRGELTHGDRCYVTIKFPLVRGTRGRVGGFVVDVTDRKQAEAALRLASVGALASGVAHEVNNPLSFVMSNVAWVAAELEDLAPLIDPARHAELRAALDEAAEGAERVRRIVRDLRQVAGREGGGPERFDPGEAVRTALDLVRGRVLERAVLEERLGTAPRVHGRAHELAEALVNVLVNAAEALPRGGGGRSHRVTVSLDTDAEGRAVVEVSDSGRGIPADELPRVLDPFFTTKEPGAGAGLGLSVARGIVTGMGGTFHVWSAPGAGTTVRLALPAASGEDRLHASADASPAEASAA
jgi:PAS domain S-box-containing protein